MRGTHEPQAQGPGTLDASTPLTPAQTQHQSQDQTTPTQTPRASQRLSGLPFPLPSFVTSTPSAPPSDAGTHGLGDATVRAPRGHDNSRVLDRITALLHKEEPVDSSNSLQVPVVGTPTSEPSAQSFEIPFKDRPAIKVLVVTWNMGDALPKGDLSVLLGEVPPYEAPEKTDELCELPIDNKHPYHIVVVAAQECPTPSGVPRGLGAGLRKGVIPKVEGLRGREPSMQLKKDERDAVLKEIRERGKERAKEREGKDRTASDKDQSKDLAMKLSPEGGKDKLSDSRNRKERTVSGDDKKDAKSDSGHGNSSANGHSDDGRSPKMSPTLPKEKEREMQAPFHTSLDKALDKAIDRVERFKDNIEVSIPLRSRTPNVDDPLSPDEEGTGALKASAPKGWSNMLEDWFCAGPPVPCDAPQSTPQIATAAHLPPPPMVTTPSSASVSVMPLPDIAAEELLERGESPTPRQTPLPSATTISPPGRQVPLPPPSTATSSSVSTTASGSQPRNGPSAIAIPSVSTSASSAPKPLLLHHPAPRSHLSTSYDSMGRLLAPPLESPLLGRSPTLSRSPAGDKSDDTHVKEKVYRRPGAGMYVNVIKERLLGMYMSVFVYKGCKHLVEGVDKSYVTAGLVGGRIGNKGGIGVSINLAGYRMLFVNAHLAAHADKMDARLANIAKIKAELKLDDFLDDDDPRKKFEDITDRFDTTFWCGDLNFRVDISQLHAKWLLDQKKYQDALMFDQLRKVMADPAQNPLPGFEEAPITFMPTFKYDVWKSMRATNREIKRSIRRRRERPERLSADMAGSFTLDGVPEVEPQPTVLEEDAEIVSSPIDIGPRQGAADWQSARSSSRGETMPSYSIDDSLASTRPSMSSTRPGSRYRQQSGTSAAESYKSSYTDKSRSHGHNHSHSLSRPINGIKDKSKKLLGMLNLGHRRSPASSRPVTPLSPPGRRQSLVSFRSSRASAASDEGFSDEDLPFRPFVEEEGVSRRASTSTTGSTKRDKERERGEPGRPGLGRSMSGASIIPGSEDDLEGFDDTVDHRVGVYDTSKKQRIPSWCDRVLWKSHVIPDDDESILSYESEEVGAFSKLSNAITTISERFRRRSSANIDYNGSPTVSPSEEARQPVHRGSLNPILGMTSSEPNAREQLATPVPVESPLSLGDEPPFLQSPVQSPPDLGSPGDYLPHLQPGESGTSVGDQPHRQREQSATSDQLRVTIADSPTLNGVSVPASTASSTAEIRRHSTRQRSVTFDGGEPGDVPNGDRSALGISPSGPNGTRRSSRGSIGGSRQNSLSRRSSLGSRSVRSTTRSSRSRRRSESPSFSALAPSRTTSAIPDAVRLRRRSAGLPVRDEPKETGSAFARFLRDLPGRFHSRVSLFHAEPEETTEAKKEEGPRRHLSGEVRVLHYNTLDDAGMRQLEGRSDHRPAIFAAAVYV